MGSDTGHRRAHRQDFPPVGVGRRHPLTRRPLADSRRTRTALPDQAPTPAVEPLTEREREVLRHVARLLDTTEIASEMYISINTVKTHMKSIHRKLAATRRSDAVRRARELELI